MTQHLQESGTDEMHGSCAQYGCQWSHNLAKMMAERDRYREALEQLADVETTVRAEAHGWAVWAHELARETLNG